MTIRVIRFTLGLASLLLIARPALAQYRTKYLLPAPGIPGSLGVNIHFNDPRPDEMEQLAAAGFKWIRMDLSWGGIERTRGHYDFAAQDRLMANLDKFGIRPIFILDYGNDLYQEGSPRSEEARAAFARFAAATVTHFKGRGALWEMWNEPNGGFWKPKASVDEYAALALATGKAIREAAPDEWYIGPGVSGMDFAFIEGCLRAGLLKYWDAVSFHPYRNSAPETAAEDYRRLRALVAQYAGGRSIPLINSEWGYSEKYPGLDLQKQGKYIVRQALSNVANGLSVSIWYDWHDDGSDPNEPEHHFGTVYPDYRPKPAYRAMATLTRTFAGYRYNKRLALSSDRDYCLLFSGPGGPRLAVWTSDPTPHSARLPVSSGAFKATGYLGDQTALTAGEGGLSITLTDSPLYLAPVSENPVLGMAERWRALPPAVTIDSAADVSMTLRGILAGAWTPRDRAGFDYGRIEPLAEGAAIDRFGGSVAGMVASRIPGRLGEPIREDRLRALQASGVYAYRSAAPMRVRASLVAQGGAELSQEVVFVSRHPLRIVPQTAAGDRLPIRIDNPTGAAFTGRVRLTGDPRAAASRPLEFAIGETARTVALPVVVRPDGSYSAGVQLVTRYGGQQDWTVVSEAPKVEYRPLEQFADYPVNAPLPPADYLVKPDGDPKVESTITASIVPAADAAQGDDAPANGPRGSAVRIEYDFAPGWKFLRLEPEGAKRAPLPGAPYALGAWVRGDGSGDILNARFTDSSGQTFQPTAGPIDWRGWRYVSFSLRGDNSGHWGGADDGVIHYPIHMDTLLLVDSPGRRGGKGTVYAGGFTLLSAP